MIRVTGDYEINEDDLLQAEYDAIGSELADEHQGELEAAAEEEFGERNLCPCSVPQFCGREH